MNTHQWIGIGLISIVLGVLLYTTVFLKSPTDEILVPQPEQVEDSTPGYSIEILPNYEIPDLDRRVAYVGIPNEVQTILQGKIDTVRERLKNNNTQSADWYELGVLYHSANDYKAAEEIWLFLTEVASEDPIAFDNLGKLYHFSLKDFPKSESYFKKSIALKADSLTPYLELFDLYRYSYKTSTTDAAEEIIADAKVQFPETIELHLVLGRYFVERGMYSDARVELEAGLNKARDAAQVNLVTEFGKELERLPQS